MLHGLAWRSVMAMLMWRDETNRAAQRDNVNGPLGASEWPIRMVNKVTRLNLVATRELSAK